MLYGLIIQSNQNKGRAWWLVGSSEPGPDMFTPRLNSPCEYIASPFQVQVKFVCLQ